MLPRVEVLMSTYNGEQYIEEQITSILNQINVDVHLSIRDDGSTDRTVEIISTFKEKLPEKLTITNGLNMGPAKSFMHLVVEAPEADYYAFADQDDIWDSDKLETAICAIQKEQTESPCAAVLYHSATAITDHNGNILSTCGKYNNVGFLMGETYSTIGCTMVFNATLEKLLRLHMPENLIMHDAWVHKVCLAVGGAVVFDKVPHIRYRQHGNNVVGAHFGIVAKIRRRIKHLKRLKHKQYSYECLEILDVYQQWMPEENIKRCKTLCAYDQSLGSMVAVLMDKFYFRGRFHWRWMNILLVLLKRY